LNPDCESSRDFFLEKTKTINSHKLLGIRPFWQKRIVIAFLLKSI
jgi:hypothetical protein